MTVGKDHLPRPPPALHNRIPFHRLPRNLIVHDPWGLVSADREALGRAVKKGFEEGGLVWPEPSKKKWDSKEDGDDATELKEEKEVNGGDQGAKIDGEGGTNESTKTEMDLERVVEEEKQVEEGDDEAKSEGTIEGRDGEDVGMMEDKGDEAVENRMDAEGEGTQERDSIQEREMVTKSSDESKLDATNDGGSIGGSETRTATDDNNSTTGTIREDTKANIAFSSKANAEATGSQPLVDDVHLYRLSLSPAGLDKVEFEREALERTKNEVRGLVERFRKNPRTQTVKALVDYFDVVDDSQDMSYIATLCNAGGERKARRVEKIPKSQNGIFGTPGTNHQWGVEKRDPEGRLASYKPARWMRFGMFLDPKEVYGDEWEGKPWVYALWKMPPWLQGADPRFDRDGGRESKEKKAKPGSTTAHLYLSPTSYIGSGNHSLVYSIEWDLPRSTLFDGMLDDWCEPLWKGWEKDRYVGYAKYAGKRKEYGYSSDDHSGYGRYGGYGGGGWQQKLEGLVEQDRMRESSPVCLSDEELIVGFAGRDAPGKQLEKTGSEMRFEESVREAAGNGWGDFVPKELEALVKEGKEKGAKNGGDLQDVQDVGMEEACGHRGDKEQRKGGEMKGDEKWPSLAPLGEGAFYVPTMDDLAETDEEWFVCPLCVMAHVRALLKERQKKGKGKTSSSSGTSCCRVIR
ncbi:hypothetical protein BKA70DRAFT_254967 [Coprinopsis sp. MPI-PUGE-AT-0042]|nr:hypothetical protein BKA70DRAFT_254967 [Coprinopsis sp. MPI-PUGE-AT-0042]